MSANDEKSSFNGPVFSRKKSLLSLQQYATSQGVSTGVVQECAKLGVVQVRKHKDKTYIVDLPLDIYKGINQQDEQNPEPIDTLAQSERISDLMNKIFQPPKHTQFLPAERQADKFSVEPVVGIPDLHLFAQEENQAAAGSISRVEPQLGRFRISRVRKIIDARKVISAWRNVTVIVTFALFISISAYRMVSIDRKAQQQKLQQAYANIQKLMSEYDTARQKAKIYEIDMINWQSEAQSNQKAIAGLQVELVQTKEKLSQAKKDLSDTRQYNAETLKLLNEQINDITSGIKENANAK
jgi:hypothetical protein